MHGIEYAGYMYPGGRQGLVYITYATSVLRNNSKYINSLWPSDTTWRHRSGSTLIQVMACCLTASSHYLHQCWLIISKVLWHSSEGFLIRRFEDTNQWIKIEDYIFKIAFRSPTGQWVNLCFFNLIQHDKGYKIEHSLVTTVTGASTCLLTASASMRRESSLEMRLPRLMNTFKWLGAMRAV